MYRPPLPLGKIGETPSPIFPEGTGGLYTGYHFPIGQYSNVPLKRIWFSGSWASNRLNNFRVKKEIACLKRGSELTDFCLKHAQVLKASATHPHLNFHWVPSLDVYRDTQRGARVKSWRQRPMWGEFAFDYFACSMRIIQHTPGGLGAPLFFFQVTWLGNWGVYYFSVYHLGRMTNLVRTKSRKSKEIQALKCFETLMFEKPLGNKDNHAIQSQSILT